MTTHWLASADALGEIDALCLGTGRFLRSVLVPALVGAGLRPALIQTRGRTFMEYMETRQQQGCTTYEVDTVLPSGETETDEIPCWGAFSLGREKDKDALIKALDDMKGISVLGVGVTEAGLSSKDTTVMKDLYKLLSCFAVLIGNGTWDCQNKKICVVDMDNVPQNGDTISNFMQQLAAEDPSMQEFLTTKVVFCNTMVDRITSQRDANTPMVPKCEPIPKKALVVLDEHQDLPEKLSQQPGVVLRSEAKQLNADIALKLRVANGTHTAIAHALALLKLLQTDALSTHTNAPLFMAYLDSLVEDLVIPGALGMKEEAPAVYDDWRRRLVHPFFGLSSFFITQNGPAKGGIRWGPTVKDLERQTIPFRMSLAIAYAVLLRWLTPVSSQIPGNGVFRGWLDGASPTRDDEADADGGVVEYADGLKHNLEKGWYEFKCPIQITAKSTATPLPVLLHSCLGKQPADCVDAVRAYLAAPDGGNLGAIMTNGNPMVDALVDSIAVLYARLLSGDGLTNLLDEFATKRFGIGFSSLCSEATDGMMVQKQQVLSYKIQSLPDSSALMKLPVTAASIESVVAAEVQGSVAIDLHTHLLPPTHGALCLWGIDELLSYHYLVAEYFMTAPASMTPETFFAKSKQEQADLVWKALFMDRTPISEATRGVVTTLKSLGLAHEVATRDLEAIRKFYRSNYRVKAEGTEEFVERVFRESGIEYAIMTNIPFDVNEAKHWRPQRKGYSKRFRSALRVDPLLAGDRTTIEATLKASGYDLTLEGARQYLRDWCDTMTPEYMMASTPHDFVLKEGSIDGIQKTGLNEEAMMEPFAFVDAANADCVVNCDGVEDEAPSVIDENSDFLSEVLMKVCQERDLPVALKIGAHRGVNPRLKAAGDGIVAFADAGMLGRLCARFPKVRFLATFLSRNNQHEACVLASKFRNLHIYGCWWYCNNPSMIHEITQMRVEMLGTAFTAQHSDARVVDQLLYKWPHSRAVIARVLTNEFSKTIESGWQPTRFEIRRDVRRLLGGSYEEFMSKSLLED